MSKVKLSSQGLATQRALEQLATRFGVPPNLLADGELPKKWETVGDVLMVPPTAFQGDEWARCGDELWAVLANAHGCTRAARKAEIDSGLMRESRVELLWVGPGGNNGGGGDGEARGPGWVDVRENGLTYSFDLTKVMFSSGNVTEKSRMGHQSCAGEVVVDLFAGIGYYTVPLLHHAGAAHVHACEWNPNSVEALKLNLHQNSGYEAAGRCTVHAGDNRDSAPGLAGIADRVLLGLLPSSEGAWDLAVGALRRDKGGWLHVHENVAVAEREEWLVRLLSTLDRLAKEGGGAEAWAPAVCHHVERVKSYAPRVDHIVVDVFMGPPESSI